MNEQYQKEKTVAVVGGGTMGSAIANILGRKGLHVHLWVYEKTLVDAINHHRENSLFLPGIQLSEHIEASNDLQQVVSRCPLVFSVTPAQVIRTVWGKAAQWLRPDAAVICASKGVEIGSTQLLSEVLEEATGLSAERLAFVSGPSFAKEILTRQPTAVVVASRNESLAARVQHLMSTSYFRAYTTDDVVGVELGGAIKNVIAIAVGVAEGIGLGINSRSALITRGLAEVTRLAVACGGEAKTLAGLAGMGDLVLTCTGHLSRNLQVGIRLGQGESIDAILGSMNMVAEGVSTAGSVLELARFKDVEMPITEIVVQLLKGDISPSEAIPNLMTRKLRSEKE